MKDTANHPAQGIEKTASLRLQTEGGYCYPMQDGLFGINAEITRKGFFGGLSAEMLNNRKLLMGQEGADGWSCLRAERVTDRLHESLCHSRFVILKDGGRMEQSSAVIALQEGREYLARAWVRAVSGTAEVTFGVAGLEQNFTVCADGRPFCELAFTFPGRDMENGCFSVSVKGEVAVYELSLLPTDHFYGMRRDVIASLRKLAPTSIRYPGGCFADHYEWRECLKAPEYRTPVDGSVKDFMLRDTYGQDPLDIGVNEFMMLCREVGAEPEFTVSILRSDGADARDLIEYCNGSPETPFGALRQSLGFDAFHIRTWYVGNEIYYFGAEYQSDGVAAARRTSEIVNAMRSVDPHIEVILGFVSDDHLQKWSHEYRENLTCTYELISYHRYNGTAPNAEPDGKTACKDLESSFRNDTDKGLDFYREQLFRDTFDTARVCVDEWNFCWGSGSNNALLFSNALELHFFARTAEKYRICEARFFMPVSEGMITVTGAESRVESSGEMFRLMAGHRGGTVLGCTSDGEELDILCTDHGGYLYLSAVNRSSAPCRLRMEGFSFTRCAELRVHDFSFFSNDYELITDTDATVGAHSVLFARLEK